MSQAIDEMDIKILGLLQRNCHFTNKEISDKVGRSVNAVVERIKRLEEEGYIEKYVAILNKELIDRSLIAFTTIQLKEHSAEALRGFARECIKFQEVMECYHLTGTFDFLLKIAIEGMKEYEEFLMHKLATLSNIGVLQSFFVLSEKKVETAYELNVEKKGKKIKKGK